MYYKEIDALLGQQERDVARRAEELADAFWSGHFSGNSEKDKSQRSALGLRVRYRQGSGSLEASWSRLYWIKGKDGKIHLRSEHIRKGTGSHGYSESKLLRYAQDWEREVVLDTERQLAVLREEFAALRKTRVSLRKARKVAAKGQIGKSNDDESEEGND